MDSPERISSRFNSRFKKQINNMPDDSGYTTGTPSSAECTAIIGENSLSQSHNFTQNDSGYANVSNYTTPLEKGNPFINRQFFHQNINSPLLESEFDSTPISNNERYLLKKKIPLEEQMDFTCETHLIVQNSNPSSTSNMETEPFNFNSFENSNLNYMESNLSITLESDIEKIPKYKEISTGFIQRHNRDHRLHKSSNYNHNSCRQKLGTPEKNKLLYSHLKPISPKRTLNKSSKTILKNQDLKCKKTLSFKKHFNGIEHVDILKLLKGHEPTLVTKVFSYLSSEDISNVFKVSNVWKDICFGDSNAENRRKAWVESKQQNKENSASSLPPKSDKTNADALGSRMARSSGLRNRCNIIERKTIQRSPPVSPKSRRFQQFIKAGSHSSFDLLRHCPRCEKPSKLNGQWATCEGLDCGFVYCSICCVEKSNNAHSCQSVEGCSPRKLKQKRLFIGSKTSKRNLKRL